MFEEKIATLLFLIAVLHTFLIKVFQKLARRFRGGSFGENFFHLLGEVEIVFGLWAGIFLLVLWGRQGSWAAIHFLETRRFTEPVFVFVIMAIASTRPLLWGAEKIFHMVSQYLFLPRAISFYSAALILGPLLGSVITEPAAMTLTALILRKYFFDKSLSTKFKYATLGVLFVNVSVGGVLTHYAAPPVVMVAHTWNWDTPMMFSIFGWKAVLVCFFNVCGVAFLFRRELLSLSFKEHKEASMQVSWFLVLLHLLFLIFVVMNSHHLTVFLGLFLFFLGLVTVTREYQSELKMRESLLVGFFLAGLVTLGSLQQWWLEPVLKSLSMGSLFIGITFLTAVTDNAALTYLGSLVSEPTEAFKYALMAGAITGGGLTVIANAPNPAGFVILRDKFGRDGINPLYLFLGALGPTIVGMTCFWFLR